MIVINYGLYDFFGEIEYAAVTVKADTALELIKADLYEYLQSEIQEADQYIGQSESQDKLMELSNNLTELGKITTLEEYAQHPNFHYEEWSVSGIYTKGM